MKYASFNFNAKDEQRGGDYWKGVDYDEHLKLTEYQSSYKYFKQRYPQGLKILEAGCGLGRWAIRLAQDGHDVTGIEVEEEALWRIRHETFLTGLSLVVGDIFEMGFKDKSFDVVLSLGVLEHFEKKDVQKQAILEHVRVLKDDGAFFVTVPYLNLLRFMIHIPILSVIRLVSLLIGRKTYFTEYRYTRDEFKRILLDCGLEVTDTLFDDFQPPYSMGLTVGFPFKKLFLAKTGNFRLNLAGRMLTPLLPPVIASGGIGYVCKKRTTLRTL